jgi:hypothetical protein
MSLKLVIESPEKIRLFNPDLQSNLKTYLIGPLIVLLIFSPLLYFFGIFHPSYQIYCEEKSSSYATGCRLKSTYYLFIPWYTQLGNVKKASFQINHSVRRNKKRNSCGEIALLTTTASNPLSYAAENQSEITFYLSCGNFEELIDIAHEINDYLTKNDVKKFNLPSLPITLDQYLWTIGLMAALLYQSKRTEVSFDKRLELVTVKTTWIISWTETYPLRDVKEIVFHQTKDEKQHLIMKLLISKIDIGDITDLDILEQKNLRYAINDFLGLK